MLSLVKKIIQRNPTKANYKFLMKDWSSVFDLNACKEVLETKRFSSKIQPIIYNDFTKKNILVISSHTDDDTFGCSGTLKKFIDEGSRVKVIYIFNDFEDEKTNDSIAKEAKEISSRLGTEIEFLDGVVGESSVEKIELITKRLREKVAGFNPEMVFSTFILDDHADHRLVNKMLVDIIDILPERVEFWMFQIYTTVIPNIVVDITDKMDFKKELMGLWKSVRGNRNWSHYIMGMNAANCRYIPTKDEVFAEGFFVLPRDEYVDVVDRYYSSIKNAEKK